jgi:hypothetical protein
MPWSSGTFRGDCKQGAQRTDNVIPLIVGRGDLGNILDAQRLMRIWPDVWPIDDIGPVLMLIGPRGRSYRQNGLDELFALTRFLT